MCTTSTSSCRCKYSAAPGSSHLVNESRGAVDVVLWAVQGGEKTRIARAGAAPDGASTASWVWGGSEYTGQLVTAPRLSRE
jgi:hypothetical protein